ncbi:putative Ig domain-containing protein [Ancylothrix sp. C2]|uniref:putative Ig domain-containing protein n=1 Tax=Ancylothrix sp. D3o TaxID=2953691 RepID=UPI0021BB47A8|nr:putative Ig domain-containing protein [Ancylothrix sp. D3o]MCT7952927.1 putative Ig domain-containing protein [Ancylothrix sp. D3o]
MSEQSNPNKDVLIGTIDADILAGIAAADILFGLADDDLLFGNTDDDLIFGNTGNDTLHGGKGKDLLQGGADDDQVYGDLGNDTVKGELGNDTLFGGCSGSSNNDSKGNDLLIGNNGDDLIFGNGGEDQLFGNTGIDTLAGGKGNDTLNGGVENDILSGDMGDDRLVGDLGADTLSGKDGNDTFVIGLRKDIPGILSTGGAEIKDSDYITDFVKGSDKIEFIGGLTFEQIKIFSGTGEYAGFSIIQETVFGQYLAILRGIEAATIERSYFVGLTASTPAYIPTPTPTPTNNAPTTGTTITSQTATEKSAFQFTIPANSFSDSDGDTLSYSVKLSNGNSLPSWLKFDAATKTFAGTPTATDIGTLSLIVSVSDGKAGTATQNFDIVINAASPEAPFVATPIADQNNVLAGTLFNYTIPAGTFTDPQNDNLTYTATLADGTPLPSWLQFNPTTLTFNGTPTNANVGVLGIKVTATDPNGNAISDDFNLTVNAVNNPPVAATISNQNATENAAFNFAISAGTFSDVDAGDSLTYTATLADGSALPSWLTFNSATQTFSGTPANGDVRTLSVKVTATDTGNASVSSNFDIVVTNVNDTPTVTSISNQNATENAAFSFAIPAGTFNDTDAGDTLTYTATLPDGTALPAWLSFNAATQTFSGTPANGNVGTITVKVTATDTGNASVSSNFNIVVANVNDAPTVTSISNQNATENAAFSFAIPAGTLNDTDAGDTLTYSATLADQTALPAWLTFNAATQTFSGTPLNENVGTLSVKVTATDTGNASVSSNFDIVVANVNDAPTLTATPVTLTAIDEDATTNNGEAVDITAITSFINDVDVGAVKGIAVTGVDNINGKWQYTTDGTTWNDFSATTGSSVDISNAARLLTASATNKIRFVPNPNYNGSSGNITFRAWDTTSGINGDVADISLNGGTTAFSSTTNTASLTVNAVNEQPVAVDDLMPDATVLLRTGILIQASTLLVNDSDAENDTLTVTSVSNPTNGTVSLINGLIKFNPTTTGNASFIYTVSDENGGTAEAAVNFNITSVNSVNLSNIVSATNLPLGAKGFVINGEVTNEMSGFPVSSAGDVNGDGLADFIVAAPGNTPSSDINARKSYLVFGKIDTTAINLNSLGTGGFIINGEAAGDRTGWSVSSGGDVNGDGFGDLIIGAPEADPASVDRAGKSYVVFGKTDTNTINLISLGSGGFIINGEVASDISGYSVSSAGDVNGDGLSDLIVGAPGPIPASFPVGNPGFDPTSGNYTGKSYVVFGKTDTTPINLSFLGTGGFIINGQAFGDQSGFSVSNAGDVNGDGFADLIVGARYADPASGSAAGKSYLVFGKTDATAINLSSLGTGGFIINGEAAGDFSGFSVNSAGDVNGDGLADVVVGTLFADTASGVDAGKSYLVFGKTNTDAINLNSLGTGGFTINGEAANDFSGISVNSAGDVNGDGLADLIVGGPGADPASGVDAGKSYLLFGKTDANAINLNSLGTGGFIINGETAGDSSGVSVSSAGDINGDGFADLMVGVPGADPAAVINAGKSYVIFGGDFTGAVTQLGTDAVDNLTGTANNEALVGAAGDDILSDGGFTNVLIYGGTGNDSISINNANFRRLDGGLGNDTLVLAGSGITLDLTGTSDNTKIASFETIDLTGIGNNTLALSYGALLNLVEETRGAGGFNRLTVRGDSGDVVTANLTGFGFTSSVGTTETTYTKGNLQLVVENDINQTGITV